MSGREGGESPVLLLCAKNRVSFGTFDPNVQKAMQRWVGCPEGAFRVVNKNRVCWTIAARLRRRIRRTRERWILFY